MKKILVFIPLFLFVLSFSSCKKCYTCKKGTVEEVVCKQGSQSTKVFRAYITIAEDNGWQCK